MVKIKDVAFGDGRFGFVLGPCAMESLQMVVETAVGIREAAEAAGAKVVLKLSYDKANRTRPDSFRGPGLSVGLEWMARAKEATGLPLITDIHEPSHAEPASRVADALQIPAFLCRQTDLILAAGRTGLPVNVKKGQFMDPRQMEGAVHKARLGGARGVLLTERGTFFGYGDLVVDMRSLVVMRRFAPVLYDATHSLQRPGPLGSGGSLEFLLPLTRAAVGAGVDGIYAEVHPDPKRAKSDPETQIPLARLQDFLEEVLGFIGCLEG